MGSKFVWYDLNTTAPAAARDFYAAVFGWTYETWGGAGYTMFCVGGSPRGGFGERNGPMDHRGPRFQGRSLVCWNVDNYGHDQGLAVREVHVEGAPRPSGPLAHGVQAGAFDALLREQLERRAQEVLPGALLGARPGGGHGQTGLAPPAGGGPAHQAPLASRRQASPAAPAALP